MRREVRPQGSHRMAEAEAAGRTISTPAVSRRSVA